MPSFAELSSDTQLLLYEQAATRILQAYDFKNHQVRVEPLTFVNNAVFKVEVQDNDGTLTRVVLRIHRPGSEPEESIRSELRWLIALQQDTTLKTPCPVPTKDGALVVSVSIAPCSEPLHGVLFGWLEGRFLRTSEQSPSLARQVGQFIGASFS